MAKRWYVVHAYSGYEKQVMRALHERIERFEMQDVFGDVLVPTEEVIEMRAGKKRRSERKFYPGYVLVNMELNDAIVLKISKQDKDTIRNLAKKERLSMSAYVRQKMCADGK